MVWRKRYIWDPFEELRRMEEFVGRAFGETGPDYFGRQALPGTTGEELAETATPYVDIKEKEDKEEGYIRRERSYRKFYRSIPLPTEVDKDNVEATFENGVLRIEMPKIEGEEVKKIELK